MPVAAEHHSSLGGFGIGASGHAARISRLNSDAPSTTRLASDEPGSEASVLALEMSQPLLLPCRFEKRPAAGTWLPRGEPATYRKRPCRKVRESSPLCPCRGIETCVLAG
jgi:hypothetical protein